MYSFSAVSSSTCAYGNAALNMPVALMKPSLERRCSCLLAHLLFSARAHCDYTYHQEVSFRIFLVLALDEDTAAAEVFGKRHAKMGIVKSTQVLRLGRIARANLARLDLELRLSQASSLYQDLICLRQMLALLSSSPAPCKAVHATYALATDPRSAGGCVRREALVDPLRSRALISAV